MRSKVWCSERNHAQSASTLRTECCYQRRKRRTCRPVQVLPLGRPLLGYASFDSPRPQLLTSGSRSRQLLKYRHYAQNPPGWGSECNGLISTINDPSSFYCAGTESVLQCGREFHDAFGLCRFSSSARISRIRNSRLARAILAARV